MDPQPEGAAQRTRSRRMTTLLTAAPVAAVMLGAYAFSALQMPADAGASPTPPTKSTTEPTPYATPAAGSELTPIVREHDLELHAYMPHGG